MPVAEKSCPGLTGYMKACSEDSPTSKLTRKFWKIKSRWLHGLWHLRYYGFRSFLKLAASRVISFGRWEGGVSRQLGRGYTETAPLKLQPGELVRVKSEQQIKQTLDSNGRNRGLLFMPCMRKYCERELRVYKRLERILLESTGEYRKLKDTVLLDGVICDGAEFGGCDRSCFHYWREVWLERV